MKKRVLAMFICVCTMLSMVSMLPAYADDANVPQTVSFYEGTDGFFYPFNLENDWTKSKLNLAGHAMSSYLDSDGINDSGMLQMKNEAGSGAISAGVNAIAMEADKELFIRGKVRYANHDKLVEKHMYIALFLTGLAGAPLYSDAACTVKTGEATGGFVTINVSDDTNGATLSDGAWHEFSTSFPTKGLKHSTGFYVDLTGKTVNLWLRPYAGNAFTATSTYFTQEYLDACGLDETTPYADVLLDDFEGYFAKKAEKKEYYQTENALFFDFASSNAPDTTGFVGKDANREYLTDLDGKDGVVTLKNYVGNIATPTYTVKVKENNKLRVAGDINLINAENLNTDKVSVTAVLIYNGGGANNPVGFYEDEACTIPAESVNGNAIGQSATLLSGIGNGGWAHFSYDFDTTAVYKTSIKRNASDSAKTTVYVKPDEVTATAVWLRITSDGALASTVNATENTFQSSYLTACGYVKGEDGKWTADADATTPYIHYALDNYTIESIPFNTPSENTQNGIYSYHKTEDSLYYNFNTQDSADTKEFIGKAANKTFMESYAGKNGVVTLKDEIPTVDTPVFNIKGAENEKLRVSGDIALVNAEDLNADNIRVNALLILNGGSTNDPAGFYEDEACTIPAESVSGNAICHSATVLDSIGADGWAHFEHSFATDTVYKSTIKRVSTDSAKTTVYIKPWEVKTIAVWFRISANDPGADALSASEAVFQADYLIECGYTKGEDGKWTAGENATNPYVHYALDNLSIHNFETKTDFDDFKAENIAFSKMGELSIGDEIAVTYGMTEGFAESTTRAYLLADGETVGYVKAKNGTFIIPVTRDMFGKTLSVALVSASDDIYSFETVTSEIGTVGSSLKNLVAEIDGMDTVTWSYDVIGNVEASQVIVALYGAKGNLLSVTTTDVEAQEYVDGVVAQGSASHKNVQTAKVTVWDSLSGMTPLVAPKTVTFPAINDDPFKGDDEINVVFLGGSITYGESAVNKADAYAGLTAEWLKETYGEDKVNYYNAGKSGTPSTYGVMRLERDVLSYEPDLVFVEFAVNDAINEEATRAMESIVRTLAASEYNPYIVFLYTTHKNYTTEPMHHKIIANFYGIPEISLKDALYEVLDGKDPKVEGYFKDDVHPTELGHAVYANAVIEALSTGRYYKKPVMTDAKYKAKSGVLTTQHIDFTSDNVTRTPDWEVNAGGSNPFVSTIWEGESITFTFSGNALCIEHALNEAGAQYEVYVDGELLGKGDTYYKGVTWDQLALGFNTFDLEDGEHEVEIRTVVSDNTSSQGTQVKLYGAFVGSYVK